jgi:FAD/FMN-containing dehydrogenase
MVSAKSFEGLSDQAVKQFAQYVRGDLLLPSDDRFEPSRKLWNSAITTQPEMIVQAAGVSDVLAAIDFAGSHDLPFSVKAGGHGAAGYALVQGGVTVDVSRLSGIRIDPRLKIARVEAGATWKNVGAELSSFNLAIPSGKLSTTGVAGTTLAGGIGWLLRKHGMTIDSLLSVDIVTANGEFVTANTAEHPDLFWAIRGGGGNFGVATSFEYRMFPVQLIHGAMIVWPLSRASEVLKVYREYAIEGPEDLTAIATMMTLPDGTKAIAVVGCFAGPLGEGEQAFAPFLAVDAPLSIQSQVMPYRAFTAKVAESAPAGFSHANRSSYAYRLGDQLIDALIQGYVETPSPHANILIEPFGGEAARVPAGETAFYHRDANFIISINASWLEEAEADVNRAWADGLWQHVRPVLSDATYVNFLDRDEAHRIPAAYGANYDRLRQIKKQYDPTNFFRSTWNIPPAE